MFHLARAMLAAACAIAQLAPASAQNAAPAFGDAVPVAPDELGRITGKADTAMMIRAQNNGTVSQNSIVGQSQTGTISFDSQAFQNMSGLALLSSNTGNNVSINASLNVNVAIRP